MKRVIIIMCSLILFISCWTKHNTIEKARFYEEKVSIDSLNNEIIHKKRDTINSLDDRKVEFSFDSLYNINYFDYYGKTLKELMENNIINQNDAYNPMVFESGLLDFLELRYSDGTKRRGLKIYFTKLKFVDKDSLRMHRYVSIEQLLKETIKEIEFTTRYHMLTETEEETFLENLQNIDIKDYVGKPIENIVPILKKWSSISFDYTKSGDKRCLDDFYFFYVLEEGSAMVVIEPLTFDYTERCIDISNKSWNLNDLRKELVGDIKIRH